MSWHTTAASVVAVVSPVVLLVDAGVVGTDDVPDDTVTEESVDTVVRVETVDGSPVAP
jgi:hypothetical protein